MAKTFKVRVVTPVGVNFDDQVLQVEIRTKIGYMGILANHEPVLGSFVPSISYFRDANGNRLPVIISSGIFHMDGEKLTMMTDFFYFADKIDDNTFKVFQEKFYQALAKNAIKDERLFKELEVGFMREFEQLKKVAQK